MRVLRGRSESVTLFHRKPLEQPRPAFDLDTFDSEICTPAAHARSMTAQVQSLPININFSDRVSVALYGGRPHSVWTHTRLVNLSSSPVDVVAPNARSFGMGLPSPPPERDEEGCFPTIHTEPVDFLIRSGIANAALAAAAHQPDAEAAFFVADLGHVYRQHLRWKRCLPNVTPFYGEQTCLSLFMISKSEISVHVNLTLITPCSRQSKPRPCSSSTTVRTRHRIRLRFHERDQYGCRAGS